MDFINESGIIGTIMTAGTQSLTGSIVASLLMVFVVLAAICILFGIELEWISVLLLPICISVAAYYSTFMGPLIVILIYISTIIAKNWLFR